MWKSVHTHTQKKKSALKNEEEETGRIESLLDIHLEEKKKKKSPHRSYNFKRNLRWFFYFPKRWSQLATTHKFTGNEAH